MVLCVTAVACRIRARRETLCSSHGVAPQVRGCCRLDKSQGCVVTNWHDLLKYTHMGRTITAAMCGVSQHLQSRSSRNAYDSLRCALN